ncbi:MAG: ATP-dependent 6-phosphofructokinase [Candidatus Cloacimonadaceae bacterium]|nr:ATP-dependent 6-phosphofructokinase [Candidatus Cloacimonadota bacterium]MDY0126938.1 ATP-dependent 6-phosphofructokinase [Candidatus Cloacimonadaceae bacterium]MCB5254982.1 ATP-dependent 6-phosphofructokinase [Candidatus Cloacimonadota bacterium]MCK9177567.1 ATP-dependent 6-phosphofructokinase [Candidatus Cloacimonadota bacterium]MCK9242145.1 ATP-dependent 6-phosphofructokinase [Candidatus Cloacimonadota bacterium]
MRKRLLIATGGGDCPGLNAVIRAIVKRASQEQNWEILGSIDAFDGIMWDPMHLVELTMDKVAGIHVMGGTILGTTNKGGPFAWPVRDAQGNWTTVDRSQDFIDRLRYQNIDAVINIGGDGSQRISQKLFEMGCPVIGIPKTIDNDLSDTDFTFGFQTAVDAATDAVDKLVTTAASHHRVLILEVMGRYAGWIALHAAIAGGAEVCLIPEIPYNIDKVMDTINERVDNRGRGFANIVIAEGAFPIDKGMVYTKNETPGAMPIKLGGAALRLSKELSEAGCPIEIRETILGHLQRGGTPNAFDRILASQFGVAAFELALQKKWGHMVSYRHPNIEAVLIQDAIKDYNLVNPQGNLIKTARGLGISMGD